MSAADLDSALVECTGWWRGNGNYMVIKVIRARKERSPAGCDLTLLVHREAAQWSSEWHQRGGVRSPSPPPTASDQPQGCYEEQTSSPESGI